MNSPFGERVAALTTRAAKRSLTVHPVPEGFQLANPWRVVVTGHLDNLEAYLTAAEQNDGRGRPAGAAGTQADF